MEAYYYAQIDGDGVCVGISQLSGEVFAPNMIKIEEHYYNTNLLGRLYKNGVFIEAASQEEA